MLTKKTLNIDQKIEIARIAKDIYLAIYPQGERKACGTPGLNPLSGDYSAAELDAIHAQALYDLQQAYQEIFTSVSNVIAPGYDTRE